jgi:hypothetical protein
MEGWRDGGMEGWRDGGMEGWRDGGMEGWRDGGMGGVGAHVLALTTRRGFSLQGFYICKNVGIKDVRYFFILQVNSVRYCATNYYS